VNDISEENIWNGKSWKVGSASGVGEKDNFLIAHTTRRISSVE